MNGYPLLLKLEGRRCVVIGGGEVAARKAEGLVEAGARVVVVAPQVGEELLGLAASGRVELHQRPYRDGDLRGAILVIAATDDPGVNDAVWRERVRPGQLVNTVDVPERCNAYVPAVVRRGPLTLSVSTDGNSPAYAGRLRRELEDRYGEEVGEAVSLMGELRARVMSGTRDPELRRRLALRIADGALVSRVAAEGVEAARRWAQGWIDLALREAAKPLEMSR